MIQGVIAAVVLLQAPAPAVPPADSPIAAASSAPTASSGYGRLTVDGLIQIWLGAGTHPDNIDFKVGGFGARLRRTELELNGEIDPKVSFRTKVDFSRSTATALGAPITNLQDVYVDYNLGGGQHLHIGEEKIPLTEAGQQSSARLLTIERPLFVAGARTRAGFTTTPNWGDQRDIGVQYLLNRSALRFQGAISKGAGDYQNSADNKYGKQFTGQLFWRPSSGPLQLGVTGSGGAGVNLPGKGTLARTRLGGSVLYNRARWYLESEYVAGVDGLAPTGAGKNVNAIRHGEYGLAAYRLDRANQAVVMYDYWDPSAATPHETNYLIGLNHDLDNGRRRVQLNLVREHYDGGIPKISAAPDSDVDMLMTNFQVSW